MEFITFIMKISQLSTIFGALALAGAMTQATAAVALFESASNVDGVVTTITGDPPLGTSGLGTISFIVTGAGLHNVDLFVDHELSEPQNTFSNEIGNVFGVPAAGQSWEIDEPGFSFGNIYSNFTASSLDNSNPAASWPDDVSMALGWDFLLAAGETATVSFTLSETAPTSGFYLAHSDPASRETVYFSSALRVDGGGTRVPDGGSAIALLGASVALMAALRRKLI